MARAASWPRVTSPTPRRSRSPGCSGRTTPTPGTRSAGRSRSPAGGCPARPSRSATAPSGRPDAGWSRRSRCATPACAGGPAILVVRGFLPDGADLPEPPTGRAEVTGWLQPGEGKGLPTPIRATRCCPSCVASAVQHVDTDLYGGYVIAQEAGAATAGAVGSGLEPITPDALPEPDTFTALRNLSTRRSGRLQRVRAVPVVALVPRRARPVAAREQALADEPATPAEDSVDPVKAALLRYQVMATIVGVLLVVLILVGVPLANFDSTSMWHVFRSTPAIWVEGSTAPSVGEAITTYLGITHGWLYMIFLMIAPSCCRTRPAGACRSP